jgi:acyl-CoA synthetase (AMP-forming)/AMP-acid ligase II
MNETGLFIISRLRQFSETDCLIYDGRIYHYSDLLEIINHWTRVLEEKNVKPGDCIVVIGEYSPEVIGLILALIINRNIIVPLAKEIREKIKEYQETVQADGCFIFNEDDDWTYRRLQPEKPTHELLELLRTNEESGIIIFTSGSTGIRKAALLQTSRLIGKYTGEARKSYRTLIFLKLDHIGGINTLFSIFLNGGTMITSNVRTPERVCAVIEQFKVQLLPTTPSFLNMLLISRCYENHDLASLTLITYGTEPMLDSTLQALNKILPGITLKQTYGLTELGIFATKSRDSASNWLKIGGEGIQVKIVENTLWIKSDAAMLGYLNAPSPFNADGWYNTGDQVEVDGEYLRILGRKEEIINVGGEKVYPAEVESVIMEISNIKDVMVTGKKSPITGHIVAAVVELEQPEDPAELRARITQYCKSKLSEYKIPKLISIAESSLVGDRFKKKRLVNKEVGCGG